MAAAAAGSEHPAETPPSGPWLLLRQPLDRPLVTAGIFRTEAAARAARDVYIQRLRLWDPFAKVAHRFETIDLESDITIVDAAKHTFPLDGDRRSLTGGGARAPVDVVGFADFLRGEATGWAGSTRGRPSNALVVCGTTYQYGGLAFRHILGVYVGFAAVDPALSRWQDWARRYARTADRWHVNVELLHLGFDSLYDYDSGHCGRGVGLPLDTMFDVVDPRGDGVLEEADWWRRRERGRCEGEGAGSGT